MSTEQIAAPTSRGDRDIRRPDAAPRVNAHLLLLVALIGVVLLAATLAPPNPASADPGPQDRTDAGVASLDPGRSPAVTRGSSGVYVGPGARDALDAFERFRGRPADVVMDFLQPDSWDDIADPTELLEKWGSLPGRRLVLSVPMLPRQPSTTLAAGALGAYDQHFLQLAHQLVDHGFSNATIRLGWEANGWWYPWAASRADQRAPGSGARDYIAYWQRVVSQMRTVPGSSFTFDWSVNLADNTVDGTELYPGDNFVDYVGVTVFDFAYDRDGDKIDDPKDRWSAIKEGRRGLDYWASFADDLGKPLSIPEWGIETDPSDPRYSGDDPLFIEQMSDWMEGRELGYEAYFNVHSHALSDASSLGSSSAPVAAQTYWYRARGRTPTT